VLAKKSESRDEKELPGDPDLAEETQSRKRATKTSCKFSSHKCRREEWKYPQEDSEPLTLGDGSRWES